MFGMCNAEFCDCGATPECMAVNTCYMGCGPMDQACRIDCTNKHAAGMAELFLLANCAGTTCLASCPGSMAPPACEVCLAQKCEPSLEKCYGNKECIALINCAQACAPGNMACPQACIAMHPMGAVDAQALNQCVQTNCSAMCK
jgi:hypothetical protein